MKSNPSSNLPINWPKHQIHGMLSQEARRHVVPLLLFQNSRKWRLWNHSCHTRTKMSLKISGTCNGLSKILSSQRLERGPIWRNKAMQRRTFHWTRHRPSWEMILKTQTSCDPSITRGSARQPRTKLWSRKMWGGGLRVISKKQGTSRNRPQSQRTWAWLTETWWSIVWITIALS